jgi:cysteinyl-tRNA synthetase
MKEPEFRPKATDTIPEIIELTKLLIKNGHAYISNGNVYFDISSFPDYGKLSGNNLDKLNQSRVESDSAKKNKHDFVLWFSQSKFKNHILKWDSPWGEGYPGWHMECSCMSAKFLTDAYKDGSFDKDKFQTIDIHTGGEDNKFPHHECEIAQTQGVADKPYVNMWMHAKHLLVEGEKMSKSTGNFYTVFELINEGYSPRAIRYLLISGHYRLPLNFTKDGLDAAKKSYERIDNLLLSLYNIEESKPFSEPIALLINELKLVIEKEMDNDLNVSGALGAIFETIRELNKSLDAIGKEQAQSIIEEFFKLDQIFGILDKFILDQELIPNHVQIMVEEREIARSNKDWAVSDELRDEIKAAGYLVKDSSSGPIVSKR